MDATTIRLQRGQLIALDDACGLRLKAEAGKLWITQADDARDIVIEAGEAFVINRLGLTLVSAPGEASSLSLAPRRKHSVQLRLRTRAATMASAQAG